MRAATYVRLSASGFGEEAPGLDRQRADVERLVRDRGWELEDGHRFHDADVSAYRNVVRPGFESLRRAVEAGEVGAVVIWKTDRAFRRAKEAADFLDLCRRSGVAFVSQQEGADTSTAWGSVLFNLFASLGEMESRTRSDRITAWHEQRAQQGLPSGGGTRPYGFKANRILHEPQEVRVIRWAADRALAGDTLKSICRRLEKRGHRTVTGARWSPSVLRRLLTSPRTAGLREHNGATYQASWRPILDQDAWASLCALLVGRPGPGAGRRYLLAGGLATCGLCGANLIARPRGDKRRCYVCASDAGGCGKIRQLAAPLEEHVATEAAREQERRKLENPQPQAPPAESVRRELEADEQALEELARDRYVTRSITDAEFRAARQPLVERVAELQGEVERLDRGRSRTHLLGGELPPAPWEVPTGEDPDQQDLEQWRAWVAEVVERVVVGPAVKGRNFFDPGRAEIAWRTPPG